jgi:hypothetical protein
MTETNEIRVADLRQNLAEVLNDTAVHGRITYVTPQRPPDRRHRSGAGQTVSR